MLGWQYRGLTEDQRRAFLFENVTDINGRKYNVPVLVGALAGSTKIYATGLKCKQEEIGERWERARANPIQPKLVKRGPVHDVVMKGKEPAEEGLDRFPFTVDVPGFDGIVRTTSTHVFSKDPETGIGNIGCYLSELINLMSVSRNRYGLARLLNRHSNSSR